MDARFRPLPTWPYPASNRQPHRFTSGWQDTLDLLGTELDHLDGSSVVIQAGFSESEIRLDGWPRADARSPAHPGVIVGFDSKFGPLFYATDRFEGNTTFRSGSGYRQIPGWQANIRAIALSLEALRSVDRYGVSTRGEQYRGWAQLPASTSGPTSRHDALRFIHELTGRTGPFLTGEDLKGVIKEALFKTHPDHGGSDELFHFTRLAQKLIEE